MKISSKMKTTSKLTLNLPTGTKLGNINIIAIHGLSGRLAGG